MENTLQKLKEIIQKATKKDFKKEDVLFGDVLVAIAAKIKNPNFGATPWFRKKYFLSVKKELLREWDSFNTLDNQSEATKTYLYNLLK